MSDDRKSDRSDEVSGRDLGVWERATAALVGLAGVGAGGAGVFLSDNQAGTTAILLMGGVFLLVGLQGTAITKAGRDSVELERRQSARRVLREAVDRVKENEPQVAAELVKESKAIDPTLRNDPSIGYLDAQIYEREVAAAIGRAVEIVARDGTLAPTDTLNSGSQAVIDGHRLDAWIQWQSREQRYIAVEIKLYLTPMQGARQVEQSLAYIHRLGMAGLIIGDKTPPESLISQLRAARPDLIVEFVTWRGEGDDEDLAAAIRRLLKRLA